MSTIININDSESKQNLTYNTPKVDIVSNKGNSQQQDGKSKKKFDVMQDRIDFSNKLIVMPPDNKFDRERLIFHKVSAYCVCPNCKHTIHTKTKKETTFLVWIAFLALLIICFPLCWVPFCMNSFKEMVHICPDCNTEIYRFGIVTVDRGARDNFRGDVVA